MRYRTTIGEKVFDTFNYTILLIACAAVLLPFLYIVASSLSSPQAIIQGEVTLWPKGFNLNNYQVVFENSVFWRSFGITVFVVIVGTTLNMFMTLITAYPLSKHGLKGKNLILMLIVFTMIFQAPMIPTYLVVKSLHLLNSVWALIIPGALAAFNMFICLTFFRSLPEELFESARIDGMKEFSILWKIAVPLSKPIMVTLILFYAVGHWNNYYSALLYVNTYELRPLQLYMYYLISQFNMNEELAAAAESNVVLSPQGLQMATILVATVPILLVYPFIQKHFIKGALIGSIKE
ncbi:carbohydrate ABC transporter permease [Paenibacillus qinlingensis]|uniref:ABC-type glycerol-3-phosphate transport system permease component n=1 Tax=Paenibacillus qinlingensis TaxID=1837343 RepID=A0ABU1P527_9BACL|nr:carbohydrate ABC transporter permease [Paenibacillus qinlingensis]MDR6554855.1 ABC-type glycerol-3-phosphate transport system permease component [Paenibacillus qinlingensis]